MIFLVNRFIILLMIFLSGITAFSQSGIAESASLALSDAQGDCGQGIRNVLIEVNLTGLTGTGGETAGLNSFVLSFDISRPAGLSTDVFSTARATSPPEMNWNFMVTDRVQVDSSRKVTVTGWVADPDAADSNYAVAQLLFIGTIGDITLTFDPAYSSLGSRVVLSSSDGPDAIPIEAPAAPFTFRLEAEFPLDLNTGVASWLNVNNDYDLVPPTGPIDLLDLSALVSCGVR